MLVSLAPLDSGEQCQADSFLDSVLRGEEAAGRRGFCLKNKPGRSQSGSANLIFTLDGNRQDILSPFRAREETGRPRVQGFRHH